MPVTQISCRNYKLMFRQFWRGTPSWSFVCFCNLQELKPRRDLGSQKYYNFCNIENWQRGRPSSLNNHTTKKNYQNASMETGQYKEVLCWWLILCRNNQTLAARSPIRFNIDAKVDNMEGPSWIFGPHSILRSVLNGGKKHSVLFDSIYQYSIDFNMVQPILSLLVNICILSICDVLGSVLNWRQRYWILWTFAFFGIGFKLVHRLFCIPT